MTGIIGTMINLKKDQYKLCKKSQHKKYHICTGPKSYKAPELFNNKEDLILKEVPNCLLELDHKDQTCNLKSDDETVQYSYQQYN